VPPHCILSHHNHSHITPIYGPDGSSVGYWRTNHIRLAAQQADTTAQALSRLTVFTNFLIVPAPLHGVRQELSEDWRDISAGYHIVYSSLAKRTTILNISEQRAWHLFSFLVPLMLPTPPSLY